MNKNKIKAMVRPAMKNAVSLRLRVEKALLKRKKLAEYNPALEQDMDIIVHNRISGDIPERVWMFWAGSTLPKEIQSFVDKVSRENPEWSVTVVNDANLSHYLPDLVFTRQDMLVAHRSDVIRLELLYKYGGVWMDASVILNRTLDEFLAVNGNQRYDMVAFYRDVSTVDRRYPVIETWFMAAPKKNSFIASWLSYFRPILTLGAEEMFKQLQQLPNYQELVQKITDPQYLILNITQQQALREYNDYNFYLRKCEANALYYQRLVSWDAVQLSRMLMIDRLPDVLPPIVKLTGLDRKYLSTNLRYGAVNKDSLLGQVLFADVPDRLPNVPDMPMPGMSGSAGA
ncbi:capsular polysaccharide synthesis protein [Erwinia sp.]|uniref:glycosyltransferase family 32 protein n=1 Tax=Erwinia citreus TaxID=558 RepID=UPI00289AD981|nr:capsular polysaccharide synthesis protein [Erwinia sp.]